MDAYVFVYRVAVPAGGQVALLLGAAITHEVGYLLLADSGHTPTGIMTARWGAKEKRHVVGGADAWSGGSRRRCGRT